MQTTKWFFAVVMVLALITPGELLAQKWSSDDDIPVVTVKKRYFLKTKRSEIGANAGFLFGDTFVNTIGFSGLYAYHLSEMFFLEATGGFYLNYNSDSTKQLINDFGITPDTDDVKYYAEAHIGWTPIYGKLNFLGKKIVYFDASLYGGGGITDAKVSGLSPHVVVGLAQRFVFTKWMALRLDVKDSVVIRDSAGTAGTLRNMVGVYVGLSFFLPVK